MSAPASRSNTVLPPRPDVGSSTTSDVTGRCVELFMWAGSLFEWFGQLNRRFSLQRVLGTTLVDSFQISRIK